MRSRATTADRALADRFSVQPADVRDDGAWPDGPFDVITAHQNVYYFEPEERLALWRRCRERMREDGRLVVVTPTAGGPMSDYFGLILLSTRGCRALPTVDALLAEWAEAGIEVLARERLIPGDSVWGLAGRVGE